jgi:alkanesulfonate monooxygenase SsuD/methylene tetrahydromethanopterin reductase-like flavin-dependent oxidoreductase (luciferase family)
LVEFFVFLPQMRMNPDTLVVRAQAAESSGFTGLALMDHLTPPLARRQPMFEAFSTAAWLLASTTTLKVGHLVLCDGFRSPAVLARQAVSLDHMSKGRFELGIGSGSTPNELVAFGLTSAGAASRIERLGETLEVLRLLWSGDVVEYQGAHHHLEGVSQLPTPLTTIPIVIGGTGSRTMELVARYADWWNVPTDQMDKLETMRGHARPARPSIQELVTLVPDDGSAGEVVEVARRRFGARSWPRGAVGSTGALIEHFGHLADLGVERVYTWFTDFAVPDTLERFQVVIDALTD